MPKSAVQAAFEKHVVVLPLNIIVPQKEVTKAQREGDFYRQITASLKHVGLIEPLVVTRVDRVSTSYSKVTSA